MSHFGTNDNLRGPRFKLLSNIMFQQFQGIHSILGWILYRNIYYNTEKTYSRYEGSYFEKIIRERNKTAFAGSVICGFEPGLSNENLLMIYISALAFAT